MDAPEPKKNDHIPKPEAIAREALLVIGGAILASFILTRFPKIKAYINGNTKPSGCSCGG